MWLLILIVGGLIFAGLIFTKMMGAEAMPFSCPRCAFGGDEDLAGQAESWYDVRGQRVRCRSCSTYFKEHPNGSLVEDR